MCVLLALASLVEPGAGAATVERDTAAAAEAPLAAGAGTGGRRLLASSPPPLRRSPPPPIRRPLPPARRTPPPLRPRPPQPKPPAPRPPPPRPPPPRPPPPRLQPPLPPHPPPAPPAPPAPPRPPPPPAQRDTEVAWQLWTRFLHRRTGFTPVPNGPAGPASTLIQKLLPETYQYNVFVNQVVPGGTNSTNAADIWSNMQYSYDPFFLYPLGSVLADALRDLYRDARDVALIPQAALGPFGNATDHRVNSYPGFNQWVTFNPNINELPLYMPAWAFDAAAYQAAHAQAVKNEQDNLGWAANFTFYGADLVQQLGRAEWSKYTLDGSSALAPPLGLSWDDPVATPQWNFLDLITSTFGLLTRRSLLDGLESYTLEARGWFYGKVGPNPKWYPAAALAAARPTRRPAQRIAASYFAARFGSLPFVPRNAAAVYSPRLRFTLTPGAFSDFVGFWTNGTAKDVRTLQTLVWLIDRNITASGSVTWDAGTRTVTALPPAGRWYRLAQVMEVVNVPYFFGGLAGAPPPPAPPPIEYLPPAPPGSLAPF